MTMRSFAILVLSGLSLASGCRPQAPGSVPPAVAAGFPAPSTPSHSDPSVESDAPREAERTLDAPADTMPASPDGLPVDERWDLLLTGGTLVDGTGAPARQADIALLGDRIARILPSRSADPLRAERIVDITGLVIAPGFIDINGQGDMGLLFDGRALNKIYQGVTTELMGESNTPAPLDRDTRRRVDENDPIAVRRAREWTRFGAWLEEMEAGGVAVNVGSFIGGTTVRRYAMGFRPGTPSPAELDTMRAVVARAMEDGALGVATGLIYPPGAYAGTDELVEISRVVHEHGGVYISHIRSESYGLLEALGEAIEIGERSGVPVEIYHLKAAGRDNWGLLEAAIDTINAARTRGIDIEAGMYPYTAASTSLTACLPPWVSENGRLRRNLEDSVARARIVDEFNGPPGDYENWCRLATPEGALITSVNTRENLDMQGKTLADLAEARGKPWAEATLDFLAEEGNAGMVYFAMSEENVRRKLQLPWMKFGTDAGIRDPTSPGGMTHPRTYGTYPKILGQYVRDEGVISLEDAIRKATQAVARRVGLEGRGELAPGYFADLVVFDPATIREVGSYTRPHALAEGVRHLLVNGSFVIEAGEYTGAKPGRFLRGPGAVR